MGEIDISVIIPCFNEEGTVSRVLCSLSDELAVSGYNFEIIFCDNGSTDNSVDIATRFGAKIVHSKSLTVAGVRNDGVRIATGALLIFIDADIVVQGDWGKRIRAVYNNIVDEDIIVGSHPTFPTNIKPLLGSWYKAIANDGRNTHFGTGHMMLSADNFKLIGGFDESLVTGEDYDFCYRAKQFGLSIINDHDLLVCHLGYPNSLLGFARREVWHGEGDCSNLKAFMRSKVAICGFFFLVLNVIALLSVLYKVEMLCILMMFIALIVVLVNYYKFKYVSFWGFVNRSIVCYCYLISRGLALPCSVWKRHVLLRENIEDEKSCNR